MFFGKMKQPIPGTLLVFHPVTGQYFVTVFFKVQIQVWNTFGSLQLYFFFFQLYKHGVLFRGPDLYQLCSEIFSVSSELPCLGWNEVTSPSFDPGLFDPQCKVRVEGLTSSLDGSRVAGRCQECLKAPVDDTAKVKVE